LSTERLTPFAYAVLALVGDGGAGPHDLVLMMRRGSLYWVSAESQWYSEPKRLEQLGYLVSDKQPGRTRERTRYRLTPKGRKALRAWQAEPSHLPRIQSEAIVRLLAGDVLHDDEKLLESLEAMRVEIEEMRSTVADAREIAETIPHRERYLRLVHRFGEELLDAHERWLDEVERELG
jgi:DNA-binding PadR family transcriptional regulator